VVDLKRLAIALTSSVGALVLTDGFVWAQATITLPTIEVVGITPIPGSEFWGLFLSGIIPDPAEV
jgi:hypothetical protein